MAEYTGDVVTAREYTGEVVPFRETPGGAAVGVTQRRRPEPTPQEYEASRGKVLEAILLGAGLPLGMGGAAGLALRGAAPAIGRYAIPTGERVAAGIAESMVPKTASEAAKMAAGGGVAGASAELGRQYAESQGVGPAGQMASELAFGMAPAFISSGVQRALAEPTRVAAKGIEKVGTKVGEKIKERLYSIPEDIKSDELTQAIALLKSKDIEVLPSEIRRSTALKAVERIFQIFPGSKQEFAKFGKRNQEAINLDVAKAFGSVEPSLAPSVMRGAKDSLKGEYQKILGNKEFTVTPENAALFRKAFEENEQLRDFTLANKRFEILAQNINEGRAIPADLWKEVRGELAGLVYGLEKGSSAKRVGKQVLSAFDDIAEKNLSKEDFDVLRSVDKKYAALMVFEDAYRRSGGSILNAGNVQLSNFVNQYKGINPDSILYGKEVGRGADYSPLVSAADIYRVYTTGKLPETQAMTLGGLGRVATGTSFLAGGLSGIPGAIPVGATMIAGPGVARQAAQAYLSPEDIGKRAAESLIEKSQRMRQATPSPYSVVVPTVEAERK